MNPDLEREFLSSLTDEEALALQYDWPFWARAEQQLPPPGDWTTWAFIGGRGVGKTRTAAEWVRSMAESGSVSHIALVGSDAGDVRRVIIEGESGILKTAPPWFEPKYEPSKRQLTWPNGVVGTIYTGAEPDQLRGPQHDAAMCDELCKWQYPQDTWDNLQFGLRLGARPRQIVTTTPRNMKLLKDILARSDTVITRGSTYDNATNLAPAFMTAIISKYEGTRLGRQEVMGDLLEDIPGALWRRSQIDANRRNLMPIMRRIVVGVDPPTTSGEDADECGIIVAGVDMYGEGWVLADLSEGGLTPAQWGKKVADAFETYEADRIVVEVNQGGEMVATVMRHHNPLLPITTVHASRGKVVRAEPVAMLYEQNRVHHLGTFGKLEDQMCMLTPDYDRDKDGSPDRLDAAVYAFTELMPGTRARIFKAS